MSDCEQLKPNYDAYALGVLEGEERAAVDAHLAQGCPRCTAGIAEARAAVAQLAYLAPEADPSQELRARVMEVAGKPQRGWVPAWAWVAAAAVLIFSIFTAIQTQRLQKEMASLQEAFRREQERARQLDAEKRRQQELLAIVGNPRSHAVALKPASGAKKDLPEFRAYWQEGTGVVLLGEDIPAPAAGRTLQLWVIPRGGKPVSAGTFRPDDQGRVVLLSTTAMRISGAHALAITEEPTGGRPEPTTTPLWAGPVS